MNSTNLVLLKRYLSFRVLFLVFLLQCAPSSLSSPPDINFEEMADISIRLNKKTIQASSLNEQIFPIIVSQWINPIGFSYQKPVDLICVFQLSENQRKEVEEIQDLKYLFDSILPMMKDHDRLSMVLFDEHNGNPSAIALPLINTTVQNRAKILSHISENILKEKMSIERGLEIALEILSQRNETNQTTGVFLHHVDKIQEGAYGQIITRKTEMEDIEKAKQKLGIQSKGLIIQTLLDWPSYVSHELAESLKALRAGVVETRLVIEPEKSQVLQGVKLLNTYEWGTIEEGWTPEEDGSFIGRCPSFQSLFPRYIVLDVKIPPISQALPSSPMEVKVASCQVIFILANGSQAVKNTDLTVSIVREKEEYINEEDSKKVMEDFYGVWESRVMYTILYQPKILAIQKDLREEQIRKTRELVKRFLDSLDNSVLRDDKTWRKGMVYAQRKFEESLGLGPCPELF